METKKEFHNYLSVIFEHAKERKKEKPEKAEEKCAKRILHRLKAHVAT